MRPEVDDPNVLASDEHSEEDVLAAVRVLFPKAQLIANDDGDLLIDTNCMWSGKHGQNVLGNMNIGGEVDECFRCEAAISSQVEVIWVDLEGRNDCGQSEDGAPHEKDAPEGWDDE